jgi:hypothetical protein
MFGFSSFSSLPFSTYQITITPHPFGGDDAGHWTKEERKRYKAIQKKLRIAEEKRIEAVKTNAEIRKKTISDLVDPPKVSKSKKTKVQSNQEVSVDIPSNLAIIDRYIANLVKQQQDLQVAVALREAKVRLEQELVILEARRLAEADDEEALLLLI